MKKPRKYLIRLILTVIATFFILFLKWMIPEIWIEVSIIMLFALDLNYLR